MFPQILSTLAQPILREGAGNIFTDIISDVFGRSTRGRTEQGQGTAIERSTTSVPQETQASGVVEAVTAPVFSPSINIGQPAPQRPSDDDTREPKTDKNKVPHNKLKEHPSKPND